jgi:hypothetical protein
MTRILVIPGPERDYNGVLYGLRTAPRGTRICASMEEARAIRENARKAPVARRSDPS